MKKDAPLPADDAGKLKQEGRNEELPTSADGIPPSKDELQPSNDEIPPSADEEARKRGSLMSWLMIILVLLVVVVLEYFLRQWFRH